VYHRATSENSCRAVTVELQCTWAHAQRTRHLVPAALAVGQQINDLPGHAGDDIGPVETRQVVDRDIVIDLRRAHRAVERRRRGIENCVGFKPSRLTASMPIGLSYLRVPPSGMASN